MASSSASWAPDEPSIATVIRVKREVVTASRNGRWATWNFWERGVFEPFVQLRRFRNRFYGEAVSRRTQGVAIGSRVQ